MAPPSVPLDDAPPPYGSLVFDCDSTLTTIEGVDALAEIVGVEAAEVAALTTRAMDGELPLEEVYAARLELLSPAREAVEALGARYVAAALPHARELMEALERLDKRVFIVSGGLRQAVLALAEHLGVPAENVHAVEAFHARSGAYQGFDELSPLCRSGGKLEVLRQIARGERGGGVALVGDGVTDLEAAPAVRRFVAFSAVARREAVLERAQVSCARADLAALLPLLVAQDELERLALEPDLAPLLAASRTTD